MLAPTELDKPWLVATSVTKTGTMTIRRLPQTAPGRVPSPPITAAVIGGLGTLPGAVWGSLVIVLVPTYATDVATSHGLSSSVASNIPVAAYGAVLILVMLVFPQGIQGALRWLLGLFGLSPGPAWRPADIPDALAPADDPPAATQRRPANPEGSSSGTT